MATNKNQHFVPRCHLRPFTLNSEGLAINLYNLDRTRVIPKAPVKSQCSGDYFYGNDPHLEKAIVTVEGAYSGAQVRASSPGYQLTDEDSEIFRLFWTLQHVRTYAAARRAAEISKDLAAAMQATTFRTEIKSAVQMAMLTFAEEMHVMDDMRMCLIRNSTDVPFITSDDPAVLTNRWHLSHRGPSNWSFGLAKAGSLMILPLSPTVLCVGYDSDIYSISQNHGWARARRPRDIDAFNQLQFLNCYANVYFQSDAHAQHVHDSYLAIRDHRIPNRHVLHYGVLQEVVNGVEHYEQAVLDDLDQNQDGFIHLQVLHPSPDVWPSLIGWRHHGVAYTNGTAAGYLRRAQVPADADTPFKKVSANRGT